MLKRHRGLLVQVSSGAGRIVLPGMGLYCASKFALEALSEALRYELGSSGVDSVSVQPGAYPTGIQSKLEVGEDAGRNAAYGAAQEMPGIVDALIKKSTANPQDVAEAVRKIIETPAGTREAHYRIGKGASGVEILNEAAAKVQSELLELFGVAELAKFRSGEAARA
jgi:NAD(P)-dependent dehydrogenase (short-subunit alcohol dehydrogenase family)